MTQPSRTAVHTPARSSLFTAIGSELHKLRTWRTGRLLLAAAPLTAFVGSVAFVASVPVTMGKPISELTANQRLEVSMMGADIASIITMVLAILFVADERTTKMLQLSLQLTPQRGRFALAKLLSMLGVGIIVSVVSCLLGFLGGRLVLTVAGAEQLPLLHPDVMRVVTGTMIMGPIHVVLGLCLAFVFRSGITAFLAAFLVMCLPTLSSLLPEAAHRAAQFLLITPAIHTLAGLAEPGSIEYTSPLSAVLILAAWVGCLITAALSVFGRQDL